jgi:hypothetical protein
MEIVKNRLPVELNADPGRTVLLAGVGRSGTTWISNIINSGNNFRYIFEPFHPFKVPEAQAFQYHQYLRPGADDPVIFDAAKTILTGRFRNPWADRVNKKWIASRRLVKTIRANLMLGWIHRHFPEIPIVFLIRHPCAVVNSWIKLGWGRADNGEENDLTHCLIQEALIRDHLAPHMTAINGAGSEFEELIFLWSILNYIPLRQLSQSDVHFIFYENVCLEPENEARRLLAFLDLPFRKSVARALERPSHMARPDSAIRTGASLTESWKASIRRAQEERALEILSLFGLDALYAGDTLPVTGAGKVPALLV